MRVPEASFYGGHRTSERGDSRHDLANLCKSHGMLQPAYPLVFTLVLHNSWDFCQPPMRNCDEWSIFSLIES